MANKTKAESKTEIVNNDEVVETPVEKSTTETKVIKENEELKATVAAMKAQMEEMQKMFASMSSSASTVDKKNERNITFTNLTKGTLVLKGSSIWAIEGQYSKRTFMEREARLIVSNCGDLIRSGAVYIDNEDFIEDNDLTEVYRNLLTPEQINGLFNMRSDEAVMLYKMASDAQKEIINKNIITKRLAGEYVDGNIMLQIGAIAGKDFASIEPEED